MYEKFNPNFQNAYSPQQLNGINTYGDQYFGEYDRTPYIEALNPPLPGSSTVGNASMGQTPYPLQSSLATPTLSTPVNAVTPSGYAKGGEIKEKKKRKKEEHEEHEEHKEHVNPYPSLAEMIRQQGEGEDTILAHINPIEAMILTELGGSGTINPVTGLPQFGWWNPIRNLLVKGVGAVLGNAILPGVGGMIGGALTGAAQHKVLGKKAGSPLMGALQGLGIGAALPTVAGLAGSGASALGMKGLGNTLSGYGTTNAILPALGLGNLGGGAGGESAGFLSSLLGGGNAAPITGVQGLSPQDLTRLLASSKSGGISALGGNAANLGNLGSLGSVGGGAAKGAEPGFLSMLGSKSKDYLSSPGNLLALAMAGSQIAGQQSPRKIGISRAKEERAYRDAMKETPEQRLAEARLIRDIEQQKFLPRELLGNLAPLAMYRKEHTPEEQRKTGKWFSYYNNPAFTDNAVPYKKGGAVEYIRERYEEPEGLGHFLRGPTGGQDDKIPAMLSDGEYIIDATTVANLGDGNNDAGAKRLDSMVKNIRKHKGGSTKLPPKAKALKTYMRKK